MRLEEHMMADKSDDDGQIDLLTKTKPKTKRPPLYKVMLLNDDFTPMEFVVLVLSAVAELFQRGQIDRQVVLAEAEDARRTIGDRLRCYSR